jgi:thiamine biosynthesis lipoprotein
MLLFTAMALLACGRTPETLVLGGPIMGTSWSVRVVAGDGLPDQALLQEQVQARLEEINALFSTYLPDSELSRFNRAAHTDWFDVSAEMLAVVSRAQAVSMASDAAFDITVGPLVNLWGFGPDGQPNRIPPQPAIDSLLKATGFELLELRSNPPALRKKSPGLYVDLSAIAKGYAVDEVVRLLSRLGAADFMVEVGGELRTSGLRADGNAWRIALESPRAGTREVLRVIGLSNRAMATSGDYRNFFELDGRRYSHSIDPRSGWPVEHNLAAVSVIADDCMSADAWATALLVLGPERAMQVAEEQGLAANLLIPDGDGFKQHESSAYQRLVNTE